jgi:hypothetical protein
MVPPSLFSISIASTNAFSSFLVIVAISVSSAKDLNVFFKVLQDEWYYAYNYG